MQIIRKSFFFSLFILCSFSAQAQYSHSGLKKLTYERESNDSLISIYAKEDKRVAGVVLRCAEPFDMKFESNLDNNLKFSCDEKGSERIYKFEFEVGKNNTSVRNRVLTCYVAGYDRLEIPLGDLTLKESRTYYICDPNSSARSEFYLSLEKASNLIDDARYDEALIYYKKAKKCIEYESDSSDVERGIEKCEAYINVLRIADSYEAAKNWKMADDTLTYLMNHYPNNNNSILSERIYRVRHEFALECKNLCEEADEAYNNAQYDLAREKYQRLLDLEPKEAWEDVARNRLRQIREKVIANTNRPRTFMYQYYPNRLIGFTYAGCKPKNSAYISLMTVSANRYHCSAAIGTIIADESVPS